MNKINPGYKETKIGVLPVDWHVCQIKDLIERLDAGVSVNSLDRSANSNEIGVLKTSSVNNGIFNSNENKVVIDNDYHRVQLSPQKGCIIISRMNTPNLVGENAYVPADYLNLFLPDRLWQTVPRQNTHDSLWMAYYFQTKRFKLIISNIATGTSNSMKNIVKEDLLSIEIPLPPLPEQKKIAEILSTWDRAIEKTEKLIDAKKKLKKGLMQQLLTGRKRFNEFEKDKWSYVFIKDILKEVNRPIEWDEAKLYPLISVRRRSGGLFYRESLYGYQIKTKNLKTARAGDFLISKMQVVHGAMGLTSEEFDSMYISDSYISLIPCDEKKLNIDFFNYLSQMRHMYYIALVSSTGVHIEKMTFDLNDFLHHKVFIPENIKEQQRIASVFSSIDNEISVLNKKLNAIKQQKKGLMQKLLTGQVRVRV